MSSRIALGFAAVLGFHLTGAASTQEPGALQKSLADLEPRGAWAYNDLASGFAEAKKSGKPLLVVFR